MVFAHDYGGKGITLNLENEHENVGIVVFGSLFWVKGFPVIHITPKTQLSSTVEGESHNSA